MTKREGVIIGATMEATIITTVMMLLRRCHRITEVPCVKVLCDDQQAPITGH